MGSAEYSPEFTMRTFGDTAEKYHLNTQVKNPKLAKIIFEEPSYEKFGNFQSQI